MRSERIYLKPLNMMPGPVLQNKKTFIVVFGLCYSDGKQAVHTYENGKENAVRLVSYPIPVDVPVEGLFVPN